MQINPGFADSFKMVELPQVFLNHRLMTIFLIYGIALHLVMNTRNMAEAGLKPPCSGRRDSGAACVVGHITGGDFHIYLFPVLRISKFKIFYFIDIYRRRSIG